MWWTRVLIFYAFISPITIFFSFFGTFFIFLPFNARYKFITGWSKTFIYLCKIMLGLRYKVIGKDNIPKAPFIAICNHQSAWETIFMQILLPNQTWVLKRELLLIPFFGWGLKLLDPIIIKRENKLSARTILSQGITKIKNNRCVLIYPEGTRVLPGANKKFYKTGAALSIAAKCPILPIAHNAGNFWPKGFWVNSPGEISISIGELIYPENLSTSELNEKTELWIKEAKSKMEPPG